MKSSAIADAQYETLYGRSVANASTMNAFICTVLFREDFLLPLKPPPSLYHRVEESHLETQDVGSIIQPFNWYMRNQRC